MLGKMKQSCPQPNLGHFSWNITMAKKTPHPPLPPLTTYLSVQNLKKTSISWIQDLMRLIAHGWREIQISYLRSLGAKISGQIWISSLIRNLWETAWYIWNFRNATLHATDGPKKTEILPRINTRVIYHYNQGITGLPKICHLLFKTNIHTLLYCPIRQRLAWIASISSDFRCYQINSNNRNYPPDVDQLLVSLIHTRGLFYEPLFQDLLDVRKAYNSLDRGRCM